MLILRFGFQIFEHCLEFRALDLEFLHISTFLLAFMIMSFKFTELFFSSQ